jgi:hypothetical protein
MGSTKIMSFHFLPLIDELPVAAELFVSPRLANGPRLENGEYRADHAETHRNYVVG